MMIPDWLQRVASITFTVIAGLLLGVIAFFARESLLVLTMMISQNAYLPRALDKVYLILLGLIWLVSWFLFEGYLNIGIAKKDLLARFLRLLGWELVALFAFSILAVLFTEAGVNWTAVGLFSTALVAGFVLLWVSRSKFATPQKS